MYNPHPLCKLSWYSTLRQPMAKRLIMMLQTIKDFLKPLLMTVVRTLTFKIQARLH